MIVVKNMPPRWQRLYIAMGLAILRKQHLPALSRDNIEWLEKTEATMVSDKQWLPSHYDAAILAELLNRHGRKGKA